MIPLEIYEFFPGDLRDPERPNSPKVSFKVAKKHSPVSHIPLSIEPSDGFPMSPNTMKTFTPREEGELSPRAKKIIPKRDVACQARAAVNKRDHLATFEVEALALQLQLVESSFEKLKSELQAKRALAENHRQTVAKTRLLVQRVIDGLPSELCAGAAVRDLQKLLDLSDSQKVIFTNMRVAPVVTMT